MTSEDEQQLSQLSCIGQSTDANATRVRMVKDATRRLNDIANSVRRIVADIDWRGEANEAAQEAFITLAHHLNDHADVITAIAEADEATAAPMHQAYLDWNTLQTFTGEQCYAGMEAGETVEAFRARKAKEFRQNLDTAVQAAQAKVVNGATWDLKPPATTTDPPPADPGDKGDDGKGDDGKGDDGAGQGSGSGSGSGPGSGSGSSSSSGSGSGSGSGTSGGGGGGSYGGGGGGSTSTVDHGGGHGDELVDAGQHHGGHGTQLVDGLHGGGHHGGGHGGDNTLAPTAHGQWQSGGQQHVQWQDAQGQWHEVAADQLQWQDAQGHWHDADGQWQDADGQWHATGGHGGGHDGGGDDGGGDDGGGHDGGGQSGGGQDGGGQSGGGQAGLHHTGQGAGQGGQVGQGDQVRFQDAQGQWHVVDAGQLQWQDTSGAWHDGDGQGPGGAWQQDGSTVQAVPDAHVVDAPAAGTNSAVWSDHVEQTFTDGGGTVDAGVAADARVDEPVGARDDVLVGASSSSEAAVRGDYMSELSRRLGG